MDFIRSLVANLGFYLTIGSGALLGCICAPFPLSVRRKACSVACKAFFWWLDFFSGLKVEVRGKENIPKDENVIFACKHQSAMETFYFPAYIPNTVFVLKKELLQIPFFGWTHMLLGSIGIDRSSGAKALRQTVKGCKKALAKGDNFIIFPEGTRTKPREKRRYQPGIGMLQSQTKALVVPVVVNFGLFWKRKSFERKKGTAIMEFLPPMPKDLSSREFNQKIQDVMEEKAESLIKEGLEKNPHIKLD